MKALDYDGTDHLIDKIYDLINSGGSADYIVEEGTNDIWYYRKWASGVYEAWGKEQRSTAMTNAIQNTYYGNVTFDISALGLTSIISAQVTGQASGSYFGTKIESWSTSSIQVSSRASASTTATVMYIFDIKGLWKEFTPSVSAKAQVGFEDLTSGISSGTSMYTIDTNNPTDTRAFRVGNLLFMNVRGTVNTATTSGVQIPWVKIPAKIYRNLTGVVSINGSIVYPLVRVNTVNDAQYLYEAITNNISANTVMCFSFIGIIAD